MKKRVFVFVRLILAVLFVFSFSSCENKKNAVNIVYIHGDTDVNVDDSREMVGGSSYVFVGFVEETYDYFETCDTRPFPDVVRMYDDPFTECVVRVVKNIKGELQEGRTTSYYKFAGKTKDLKEIAVFPNDSLPEAGKYYLFLGRAFYDGTLHGGGEYSQIDLEADFDESNPEQSAVYKKYVEAYDAQILPRFDPEPRFLAIADINFDSAVNRELLNKAKDEAKKREENEKNSAFFDTISELEDNKG